jgi:hypothetical protein
MLQYVRVSYGKTVSVSAISYRHVYVSVIAVQVAVRKEMRAYMTLPLAKDILLLESRIKQLHTSQDNQREARDVWKTHFENAFTYISKCLK